MQIEGDVKCEKRPIHTMMETGQTSLLFISCNSAKNGQRNLAVLLAVRSDLKYEKRHFHTVTETVPKKLLFISCTSDEEKGKKTSGKTS